MGQWPTSSFIQIHPMLLWKATLDPLPRRQPLCAGDVGRVDRSCKSGRDLFGVNERPGSPDLLTYKR